MRSGSHTINPQVQVWMIRPRPVRGFAGVLLHCAPFRFPFSSAGYPVRREQCGAFPLGINPQRWRVWFARRSWRLWSGVEGNTYVASILCPAERNQPPGGSRPRHSRMHRRKRIGPLWRFVYLNTILSVTCCAEAKPFEYARSAEWRRTLPINGYRARAKLLPRRLRFTGRLRTVRHCPRRNSTYPGK
jgi:hypothetical protein